MDIAQMEYLIYISFIISAISIIALSILFYIFFNKSKNTKNDIKLVDKVDTKNTYVNLHMYEAFNLFINTSESLMSSLEKINMSLWIVDKHIVGDNINEETISIVNNVNDGVSELYKLLIDMNARLDIIKKEPNEDTILVPSKDIITYKNTLNRIYNIKRDFIEISLTSGLILSEKDKDLYILYSNISTKLGYITHILLYKTYLDINTSLQLNNNH